MQLQVINLAARNTRRRRLSGFGFLLF
jgi:hypothetical protein